MKKVIFPSLLFLFLTATCFAQTGRETALETLEPSNPSVQAQGTTATLRSASRLFGEKDDLTAVIFVIPSGSQVQVMGIDSTYLQVIYEGTEGYIFNKNVTIEQSVTSEPAETVIEKTPITQQQVTNSQQNSLPVSRFSQLESKYGTSMAAKLYAGKIWKGMSTEMVLDSWGNPERINRSISSNIVKEEWIFRNTWLFFEGDRLIDWGPVTR